MSFCFSSFNISWFIVATNVPSPCLMIIKPSCSISSYAFLTVNILTPSSLDNCRTDGSCASDDTVFPMMFSLIAFFLIGISKLLVILFTSIIITILCNKYCNSKINGITGDSLGAINELVILVLLIILTVKI